MARLSGRRFSEAATGWILLTPAAAILGACVLVPTLIALALSFTQCSRFLHAHFVGFDNYLQIVRDRECLSAFGNTLYYLLLYVPLNLAMSLAVALLLNRTFWGMKIIRSIYFVPVAVSGIVAVSVFRFIFHSGAAGPVNALLTSLQGAMGFDPQPVPWLWDSRWAMLTIIFITLWKSTAFFSIIILAAMQDVPRDLYEAAAVDGAGRAAQFAHITVPSLMPVLVMVVTLSSIGAFRVFEPMFVLTGGRYDTQTIALKAYNTAFQTGELGLANAISFSLLVIILLATLAMNSLSRRFE